VLESSAINNETIVAATKTMLEDTAIPVNVKKINDADVVGNGTEVDKWRGSGVP